MTEARSEIAVRRAKLEKLRREGNPYPNEFVRSHEVAWIHRTYDKCGKEELARLSPSISVAGRMMLKRAMGKASFFTLQGDGNSIQCYVRRNEIGDDAYLRFMDTWDRGDIVGVCGVLMRTQKGELTVHANKIELLAKSLRPMPEKFHGLDDQETRYRQRYLDLISNEASRGTFEVRSKVCRAIRQFFDERGFLEVETPMLHPIPGGANARPFATYHNTLKHDLYLRIAPELYLKRLVVGGFERVYEINRNFRNEGVSTQHNPEFTMLEFYQAYETYEGFIDLTQELLRMVAESAIGRTRITYLDNEIDFADEFHVVTMTQAVADELGVKAETVQEESELRRLAGEKGIELPSDVGWGKTLGVVFEAVVEHKLMQPTVITQFPVEISPLSRRNDDNPLLADRFELFIAGREIANGFSELNDPDDQLERFRQQGRKRAQGDNEAMHFDEDYIMALEYGMPPTAGEGVGIDRLVMLLANSPSIRDVLLFPQLRPK